MKKQTKVLLAAAMLTLGASFSAMAAETKGTWVLNDEGWQYADKDGDYMDNVWAKSNGIEYWVNDDEVLGGNEWVKDPDVEDRWYYAEEDGSKTVNEWKYLYSWDDEEEEKDQYWYYFDAKGRMAYSTKKTINGSTYHFNEKGEMLTGWVEEIKEGDTVVNYVSIKERAAEGATIYTDENGAVVKSSWINVFPWYKVDAYEGEHEEWYYTTSAGKVTTGKKDINGLTYIFNAKGEMLTEWIGKDYAGAFTEISTKVAANSANFAEIYFADADYGYVKKNGWRELENAAGSDDYWFHFDKLGRVFLATAAEAEEDNVYATEQVFTNGEKNLIDDKTDKDGNVVTVLVNEKKIDGVIYYFNEKGEMIDGLQDIDGNVYFLEDGARQTGKVTITDKNENDYTFYFGEKTEDEADITKYVAVTGAYKNYIYVGGQLITSDDKDSYRLVEDVNGYDYIVDHNGKIQHKDDKDYGLGQTFKFHEEHDYILWPEVEEEEVTE